MFLSLSVTDLMVLMDCRLLPPAEWRLEESTCGDGSDGPRRLLKNSGVSVDADDRLSERLPGEAGPGWSA